MHILAQITTDYEAMGIKTMLVITIIALGTVIAYLYKSKESAISNKDERISQVIKDHHLDLKEFANDAKLMAEKYHQFTESIKNIIRNERGVM